jgi:hypothetical protein
MFVPRSLSQVAFRLPANLWGDGTLLRRWQLHASASGLGKANGNRLFDVSRAVDSFADVFDLLANKLAGLR